MDKEEIEKLKEKYTVKSDQIEQITNTIFARLTYGKTPSKNPVAVIVGGQPGAGKSGLIDKTLSELENSVILDVDDFRYFHPNIKEILKNYPNDLATFTIKFVNDIFTCISKRLYKEKYNIIAQKTLKDDIVIEDTLDLMRDAGYTIIVRILAVSEIESKLSALERSLSVKRTVGYCRWTPVNNQNYAYAGIIPTSQKIYDSNSCDSVQIYKRDTIPTNAKLVYSLVKETSKEKLDMVKTENPDLFVDNYGTSNFKNLEDAIVTTRNKNTLENLKDFMTRTILAEQEMDEEGKVFLNQVKELLCDYFYKLNDLTTKYMDNNIKLELSKEVMARKIAFECDGKFDENNEKLLNLLKEEREMNSFNTKIIDKIIYEYGKEIKNNGEDK